MNYPDQLRSVAERLRLAECPPQAPHFVNLPDLASRLELLADLLEEPKECRVRAHCTIDHQ